MPHPASAPIAQEDEIARLRQEVSTLRAQLAHPQPQSGPDGCDTLFRAIYDQAQYFAGLLAPDGNLRHANRVACALIGRPPAELRGQPFWDTPWWTHSPAEQAKLRAGIVRAAQGENVQFETLHRDAGDSLHPVNFSLRPVLGDTGQVIALVAEGHDSTAQKQALEQHRQMAAEQRTILNTITAGLCLLKERRVQWFNPAYAAMFGYSPEELVGVDVRQTYANLEDFERVGREGYARLAQGSGYSTEALQRRRDGTTFWCNISGRALNPRQLEDGSIWLLHDITQRRQADEALRLSEERLETAQAQARIGSWEFDPVTRTIVWSKEMYRLAGRDPRQGPPSPETVLELLHPDDRPRMTQATRQAAQSEAPCTCEYRSNPAHGPIRHFLSIIQSARDPAGRLLHLDGTFQEITERKRAEEAARESEHRFQRLVENSNDIIAVIDARGAYLSVSGPLKAILGYVPEELVGRTGFELLHPADTIATAQALARALADPGVTHRVENRHRHKLGHWVDLEVVGTNWMHDPVIRGVVLNIREISARKRAEQERTTLQEQLQQAMKMEAVGRLAGGVAHDFNNLLTVITGNVELAAGELAPADPLSQYLAEVARAAESAASLTRQLLAFSRRQLIEPRTINLSELVENLRKMLHRLIGEDIELRTLLAADLASVKVDPGQFDQVVVNLAVNARDAMPGGGCLTLATANVALDEAYCRRHPEVKPGRYVRLAVQDTGQGMSPDVQQRLFEPFFTTKPKGRGTGLGLAVIFGIVKQAGGSIEVESEPGQGTTFNIHLPCCDDPAEKLRPATVAPDLPRGHETILLAEDDPSVRGLATTMLKRQGYHVLTAANGDDALALAAQHPERIDLLLTDVVMPGMNGRELSERLLRLRPGLAVLFASGYTEDTILRHGVRGETPRFLTKPFTLPTLANKVRQVLDAKPAGPTTPPAAAGPVARESKPPGSGEPSRVR